MHPIVLNVVDGCIPSDMATGNAAEIEEERRLLYVAMTRARDHLYLIQPHRFERASAGSLETLDPPISASGSLNVAAKLREMWR